MRSEGEIRFLDSTEGPCPYLQGAEDLPPPSQAVHVPMHLIW